MKRKFTDAEKWIKNNWFRKLTPEEKLFWLYVNDMADCVGVWEVDFEQAEFLIGSPLNRDHLTDTFSSQIYSFKDGRKWWIKSFISFQYKEIKDNPQKPSPYITYKETLIQHGLWNKYRDMRDLKKQLQGKEVGSRLKEEKKIEDKDKKNEKELREENTTIKKNRRQIKKIDYPRTVSIKDAFTEK